MAVLSKKVLKEAMATSRKAVDDAIDEVYSGDKYYWERVHMHEAVSEYDKGLRGLLGIWESVK